jgi:hypothetical protein
MRRKRARPAEQVSVGRIIQGAPIRDFPANPYEARLRSVGMTMHVMLCVDTTVRPGQQVYGTQKTLIDGIQLLKSFPEVVCECGGGLAYRQQSCAFALPRFLGSSAV